jgi:sarcosine oxidase/L-pipecolate oxidase
VLGDKIVDALEGTLEPELRELWAWPQEQQSSSFVTNDGSRSGRKGMVLADELRKTKTHL